MTWRVENLNVENFCNGDPIPEARSDAEWRAAAEERRPAWCFYNNDPASSGKNGRLYNWYAVNDPRGLAPLGWHVPSEAEWKAFDSLLPGFHAKAPNPVSGITRSYAGSFGNPAEGKGFWSSGETSNMDGILHIAGGDNVTISKGNGFPVWLIRSDPDHPGWNIMKVGTKTWMAENLQTMVFSNGDPIPVVAMGAAWDSIGKLGKPACMLNETGNSTTIFYNFYAVKDPRKLAPAGWHVPTRMEWQSLFDTIAPGQGGALTLRDEKFNAVSTGMLQQGVLEHEEKMAAWWSSTQMSNEIGWAAIASYVLRNEAQLQGFDKKYGLTIRLIRDEPVK